MQERTVERFKLRSRWLHWIIVAAFLTLGITGLFLYVPQFGPVAQDGFTRIIHRIAAVLFIAAPVLYFLISPRSTLHFLKEVFTWGSDDIKWLKAAPDYYFGGDESRMPPQGGMNTGQKLYALVVVVGGIGFLVTGLIMWLGKGSVSSGVFLGTVLLHDLLFIGVGSFMLVHFYLGVIHPRMTESMRSMINGKVTVEYAKSHHGKWYNKIAGDEEVSEKDPGDQGEG
jgi:formate dehydrogenase subunit gamma